MDNVTHALAGLLLAECAVQARSRAANASLKQFRSAACFTSILANNFPDFDFLYAWGSRPLGYLLHHRGHTHTLLATLPFALLSLLLVHALGRFRGWHLNAVDRRWLLLLSVVGPLLHLLMDASNNYGVHPFWPFHNGWFYGDAFFILEPWFWIALCAPLLWSMQTVGGRIALGLVLLLGVGLCWFADFIPRSIALSASAFTLLLGSMSFRASARVRLWLALGTWASFAATFLLSSMLAHQLATHRAGSQFAGDLTQDLVLTPMPANPICWHVLLVQTHGDRYIVRKGALSIAPAWFKSSECHFQTDNPSTAPMTAVPAATSAELRWTAQFEAPVRELRQLAQRYCRVAAFLRFGRAPFWTERQRDGLVVGDVRYDRGAGIEFAELRVDDPAGCPRYVPPWIPPREKLLAEPR